MNKSFDDFNAQFEEDEEERNERLRAKRIAKARDDKRCERCRYWSEMVAKSIGTGPIEALCLSHSGANAGEMVRANETCSAWASNHYGAVDAPPDYGEVVRALYADEEEL